MARNSGLASFVRGVARDIYRVQKAEARYRKAQQQEQERLFRAQEREQRAAQREADRQAARAERENRLYLREQQKAALDALRIEEDESFERRSSARKTARLKILTRTLR